MICPMADWFLETGLYLLGIALIPAIGLLLVCWGLWGDRSKGRSRCPKCWYDMRGSLPRLECPECGHDAKQERRLYRSRCRWWRTALGTVLLLSACPLSIVGGWWREQAVMQRYWIDEMNSGVETIAPAWLVGRLPDELAHFFERRTRLWVGYPKQMPACRSLRHLRWLVAFEASVTDTDLVHVRGLSDLEILSLPYTQVTDAGLVHLKGLSQLQKLSLRYTQVTDAGVTELKKALPGLHVMRRW